MNDNNKLIIQDIENILNEKNEIKKIEYLFEIYKKMNKRFERSKKRK